MAFDEYDDFEQEKLVKEWIKNNWLTIALGIVLGLGGVFGINFWKAKQQQKRFDMAAQYTKINEVLELSEFAEAQTMLKEMEDKFGTSFYTIQVHLNLAKSFIEKNEPDNAAKELQAVIAAKPDKIITEFARLRLARVLNSQQKYDEALTEVKDISIASYLSIAKEIEGDALLAKGESAKAQEAYQLALDNGEGYSGKRNIQMKLENS